MNRRCWQGWMLALLMMMLAPVAVHAEGGQAPTWVEIMQKMDWSLSAQTYTVGGGDDQVSVSRSGKDVVISGGRIADIVRFVNVTIWDDDWQSEFGYHTESGSYTFRNVTLEDDIYVWAHTKADQYTITLEDTVKGRYGMICNVFNGAGLKLVNHDIIYSDSDYSMIIEADTQSSLSITGNGKILIGKGWDWSDEQATGFDLVPIRFVLTSDASTPEAAIADIRQFEGRTTVSYDQVKIADGYPPIRSYCAYKPDPNDAFRADDLVDPATGKLYTLNTEYIVKRLRPDAAPMTEPTIASEADMSEAAQMRPVMVTTAKDSLYLRSEITEEIKNRSIAYEIHLVNDEGAAVGLTGTAILYIPYPEGMDEQSAAEYEVVVRHITDDGEEIYTTVDGSLTCTPYGFRMEVTSLSPFEVSWGKGSAADVGSLPQTGDRSHFMAYLLGLIAATGMLAGLLKQSTNRNEL